MNKIIIALILIAFLFSGCNEPQRQETIDCCSEKEDLIKANTDILTANAVLEDTKDYYKNKYETARQIQLNDLQAMLKGLDGFANCHIAVTCSVNPDYQYEFMSCRDFSEADLELYINSCVYGGAYNEFYSYVEQAEALN